MSDSRSDESDFSDDGFEDDMDAGRKSSGGRRDDSDDDFEFGGESYAESDSSPARGGARSKGGSAEGKRSSGGGRGGGSQQSTKLQNLPFDEAVELASDSDSLGTSVDTIDAPSPKLGDSRGDSPPRSRDTSEKAEYGGSDEPKRGAAEGRAASGRSQGTGGRAKSSSRQSDDDFSDDSGSATGTSEEDDEDDDKSDVDAGTSDGVSPGKPKKVAGEYNPADFAHLNVSPEIKDLWNYIGRYKPHHIELETKLKCFIPDFIPAVGEIDAFIKVPPPGKSSDDLGLKVLDEPSSHQSDPTVLDLQLRAISKKSNLEPMIVRSLENADKNPKEIERWISSISELHRSKPPPQVHYAKTMPDIENLMQVWPEDFEEKLKTVKLPPPEIDLSILDYARVLCCILDIPCHQNITESLHVLFTLYSEFSSNQHFMAVAGGAGSVPGPNAEQPGADSAVIAGPGSSGGADTLSLHK
jgi:intraflagellar transport protein 46